MDVGLKTVTLCDACHDDVILVKRNGHIARLLGLPWELLKQSETCQKETLTSISESILQCLFVALVALVDSLT